MPRNLAELLDEILALAHEASSFLVHLGPLTLSVGEAVEGSPIVVDVLGGTAGGRITGVAPDGMIFDPLGLTIAGTPTTAGQYDIALRETHPQGSNSPRLSVVSFTVEAKPDVPTRITIGNGTVRMGDRRIRLNGAGLKPVIEQHFAFGPPVGQAGEDTAAEQHFAFGAATGQPGEGASAAVQAFTFGPAASQAGEGQLAIQHFAFGAATTTPSE